VHPGGESRGCGDLAQQNPQGVALARLEAGGHGLLVGHGFGPDVAAVLTDAVLGEDPLHAISTSGFTAVLDVAGVAALLFAVTSVGVELVRRGARPGLDHPGMDVQGRHRSAESVREPGRTG
jgi:hypothetical protein